MVPLPPFQNTLLPWLPPSDPRSHPLIGAPSPPPLPSSPLHTPSFLGELTFSRPLHLNPFSRPLFLEGLLESAGAGLTQCGPWPYCTPAASGDIPAPPEVRRAHRCAGQKPRLTRFPPSPTSLSNPIQGTCILLSNPHWTPLPAPPTPAIWLSLLTLKPYPVPRTLEAHEGETKRFTQTSKLVWQQP